MVSVKVVQRLTATGLALVLILGLLVLGTLWTLGGAQSAQRSKMRVGTSLAPMLERVVPAVVSVRVAGERERPVTVGVSSGTGGMAAPAPVKERFRSGGSGVVIDARNGIIVTNHHVIVDAVRIDVGLYDGRVVEAKLLGTDVGTDVAVLKVPLQGLSAIPLGDSDTLRVGDQIVAVGNPFGLEGSASQGIVSALMRTDIGYEIFEDFIQIDAAVNPGNSGGALVDVDGRLVGINTAIAGAKSRAQGIGFAIPINMAKAIAVELVQEGTFRRGMLGIISEDLNFEMARQMSLSINRGAAVKLVVPDSPAAKAGVKEGDVIVAVANKPVRGHTDFVARVATTPIGQKLKVELVSGGTRRELMLTVADIHVQPVPESPPMTLSSFRGATLGAILPGFAAFGMVHGARVLAIDAGPIADSGLKPDDVITGIDDTAVRTPQDVFEQAMAKMGKYRLEVFRGGKRVLIWVGA
ncbi:MAG: PDZ domain-containing protein [Hyphomicrobiaceae bacterium]|nr:MAG: PDZ domain-containing protein [Hyphomicrobiaceae bacterium]